MSTPRVLNAVAERVYLFAIFTMLLIVCQELYTFVLYIK